MECNACCFGFSGKHEFMLLQYMLTALLLCAIKICLYPKLLNGTPKDHNFPYDSNRKLKVVRCPNISAHKGSMRYQPYKIRVPHIMVLGL